MLESLIGRYLGAFKASVPQHGQKSRNTIAVIEAMRKELELRPPDAKEVISYFDSIVEGKPKSGSSLAFIAAWYNLASAYREPLRLILESEECREFHEQALEIMAEVGDASVVPTLGKCLDYRRDYDPWCLVPRKALRALSRIGTDEAIGMINGARNSDEEPIREEADLLLN